MPVAVAGQLIRWSWGLRASETSLPSRSACLQLSELWPAGLQVSVVCMPVSRRRSRCIAGLSAAHLHPPNGKVYRSRSCEAGLCNCMPCLWKVQGQLQVFGPAADVMADLQICRSTDLGGLASRSAGLGVLASGSGLHPSLPCLPKDLQVVRPQRLRAPRSLMGASKSPSLQAQRPRRAGLGVCRMQVSSMS